MSIFDLVAAGWRGEEAPPEPPPEKVPTQQEEKKTAESLTAEATPPPEPKTEVPFGALDVDANGNPYYGEGWKGWVRKTYADLFDPAKTFERVDMSPEDWARLEAAEQKTAEKIEGSGWDTFLEGTLGLTSQEISKAALSSDATHQFMEEDVLAAGGTPEEAHGQWAGEVAAQTWRLSRDFLQRTTWGALEIAGLGDVAARKIIAGNVAIAEMNEEVGGNSFVYFPNFSASTGRIIASIIKGEIKFKDASEKMQAYLRGSQAAYTLWFDESARDKFEAEVATGKDPGLVAASLGNWKYELAGSIAGDPLTYLGLNAAIFPTLGKAGTAAKFGTWVDDARFLGKKLPWRVIRLTTPEFGEVVGLKLGKARVAAEVEKKFYSFSPEVAKAIKKSVGATDEVQATSAIRKAIQDVHSEIEVYHTAAPGSKKTFSRLYNVFSLDAAGRSRELASTMDHVVSSIIMDIKPGRGDELLDILDTMAKMYDPDPKVADRAIANLLRASDVMNGEKGLGKLAFSDGGLITGRVLNYLKPEELEKLFVKYADNPSTLSKEILGRLGRVSESIFPSVQEAKNASIKAKELVKAGQEVPAEMQHLSNVWDNISPSVKWINSFNEGAMKVHRPIVGGMVNLYMRTIGFVMRNITGQGVNILATQGMKEAATTSLMSMGALIPGATEKIIAGEAAKLEKAGILPPSNFTEGIGGLFTKQKGAAQNAERVASARIIANKTLTEIQKAMPAVLKDFRKDLGGTITPEQELLLTRLIEDFNGNTVAALAEWRKAITAGLPGNPLIETWRHFPMGKEFKDYAVKRNIFDELKKLQAESKTAEEFRKAADVWWDKYVAPIKTAAADTDAIGKNVPSVMQDMMSDMLRQIKEGDIELQGEYASLFRRKCQAASNLKADIPEVNNNLLILLDRALQANWTPEGQAAVDALKKLASTTRRSFENVPNVIGEVRESFVIPINDAVRSNNPIDIEAAWNTVIRSAPGQKEGFSLAKIYPGVDPSKLTPYQFKKYMWNGFYYWSNNIYNNSALAQYEKLYGIKAKGGFAETAKLLGVDFDAIVQKNKDTDSLLEMLADDHMHLVEYMKQMPPDPMQLDLWRNLPTGAKLSDLTDLSELNRATGKTWDLNSLFEAAKEDLRARRVKNVGGLTVNQVTAKQGIEAALRRTIDLSEPPPYARGAVNQAEGEWMALRNVAKDFRMWTEGTLRNWGVTTPSRPLAEGAERAIANAISRVDERMSVVRSHASAIASETRDWLLFDYNRTYLDRALDYFSPFGYWRRREQAFAFEVLASNPRYASWYLSYKESNQKRHAGLPDFWRENIPIGNLPGVENTGYFLNLEQNLNPVYFLTQTDFNDRYKRTDWLTSMVDDMNKMGFTGNTAINLAMAVYCKWKGENDAASRWAGRMTPYTGVIKAITSGFGKPVETDPFVKIFGEGNVDEYEARRVNRALAQWVLEAPTEQEQLLRETQMADAVKSRRGTTWEMGVKIATDLRAPGTLMSFVGGPGLKARTQYDVQVDEFYEAYFKFVSMKTNMTAEQYRTGYDLLKQKYPFMDALLIGNRAGSERVSSFAYNVLGRLPPGAMSKAAAKVGITNEMINTFYDNKGDMTKFTEEDAQRFEGGIGILAAMLTMPSSATRQEWTVARLTYGNMRTEMEKRFGKDIQDKIDVAFELDGQHQADYIQEHPEVGAALDFQTAMTVQNPVLKKYYASIENIVGYYTSRMYAQLDAKYGTNMQEKMNELGDMQMEYEMLRQEYGGKPNKQQKLTLASMRAQIELFNKTNRIDEYNAERSRLRGIYDEEIAAAAKQLPEGQEFSIRTDYKPRTEEEAKILASLNEVRPTMADYEQAVANPVLWDIIVSYINDGKEPTYTAQNKLNYLAGQMGFKDWHELVRMIQMATP